MPPAVIGGAVAAVGAVGSAAIANKGAKKAAKAQAQSAAEQTALQREVYESNKGILSPAVARGDAAGSAINALLGLGGVTQAPAAPAGALSGAGVQGTPGTVAGGWEGAFRGGVDYNGNGVVNSPFLERIAYLQEPRQQPGTPPIADGGQAQGQAQSPAQAAAQAYEIFKASTGYQTRFNEGMRALNAGYAGAGTLQSGAAVKSALRFGQEFASGEFGNYLGYLGNQQAVGLGAGSALAGVGTNYANASNAISQNAANARSQAAIAQARNTSGLITGLAGIAGNVIGGGALSSYRQPY